MSDERLDVILDLDSRDYEISIKRAEELLSKFGLGTRSVERELQSLEGRAIGAGRELKKAMSDAAQSARDAEAAAKRANQQVKDQVSALKGLRIEAREQKRISREQIESAKQAVESSKALVKQRQAEFEAFGKRNTVAKRAAETNLSAAKHELETSKRLLEQRKQDSRDTRSLWEEEIATKERAVIASRKEAARAAETADQQRQQFRSLQRDMKQSAAETAREIKETKSRIAQAEAAERKATTEKQRADARAWRDAERSQLRMFKEHQRAMRAAQKETADARKRQEREIRDEIAKREAAERRAYYRMSRRSSDLGRRFHHTFANIALGGFIFTQVGQGIATMHNQLMNASGELERLHMLMRGLSSAPTSEGRDKQAAGDVQWLMDNIKTMPFTMREVAGSFVKLKAAGIDPMDGSLRALADSVAAFGGDSHMLHRATVAVQQMASKGVVSMEELRQQLGEAVPNAIQIMARATGMSMKELIDTVSKGQLESKTALKKMLVQMEMELGGSSERMMNTWVGLTQRLQTTWMLFLDKIATSDTAGTSYFTEVKKAVSDLIAFMDSGTGQWLAETIGDGLSRMVVALKEGVSWAQRYWREIADFAKAGAYFLLIKKAIDMTAGLVSTLSFAGKSLKTIKEGFGMFGRSVSTNGKVVGRFSTAIIGLSTIMGGLAVPVAVAGAALVLMPGMFKTAADEAREVANEIERTNGHLEISADRMKNLKEIADQLKRGEDVDGKHADNREFLEEAGDKFKLRHWLASKLGVGTVDQALAKYEQAQATFVRRKEEIDRGYAALSLNLERQQQVVEIAARNRLKDEYIRHAKIINAEKLEQIQNDYRTTIEAVTNGSTIKMAPEAKLVLDDYTHDRRMSVYVETIELVQSQIETASANLQKATGDEKEKIQKSLIGLNAVLAYNIDARNLLEQERDRQRKILELENQLYKGNEKSPAEKAIDKVQTQIELTQQKIAAMKARLESDGVTKGYAAKMDELMSQIAEDAKKANAGTEKLTASMQEAKRLAEELDSVSTSVAANTLLMSINDYAKGMEEKFKGASTQMGKFKAEIARLKAEGADVGALESAIGGASLYDREKHHLKQLNKLNDETIGDMKTRGLEYGRSQTEIAQLRFDREVELMWSAVNSEAIATEERQKYLDKFYEWRHQREIQLAEETKSPTQKLLDQWSNMHENMANATANWLDSTADAFAQAAITGKLSFSDLANSIMRDVARMAANRLLVSIISGFGGFGGFGVQNKGSAASALGYETKGYAGAYGFANGGIMTEFGSATLKQYANGGVANSPQIALFGEGSMPEAYVPLPDGRTIPVTIQGMPYAPPQQMQGGNISINLINQSGQNIEAEQGSQRFDGEKMILDVVLKAVTRPGAFRTTMKGAMNS